MKVTFNEEKNGIEISFEEKPNKEVLDQLKSNGFRWSNRQKIWYAKQTDERMELVNSFSELKTNANKPSTEIYDLFAMTRVDSILNNFKLTHEYDKKVIAADIRKHIKSRFPMCKWSVRVHDYNSINIDLKSSPFAKDSEELKAIVHYAYTYAESWNYDNSDTMTDYFDVNFYGVYESNIVDYEYEQREMTVSELNISKLFQKKFEEWQLAEEARKEMELEAQAIKREEEHLAWVEREKIRKANYEIVTKNIEVKEVEHPYFVTNLIESWRSKEDCLEDYYEYKDDEKEPRRVDAEITRELYMDAETYKLFTHQLMDDFDFLNCMGGSGTLDNRINSHLDYDRMSEAERKTVTFYSCKSVAIFCDNEMKFVIDPQGYSYARYCFVMDEKTSRLDEYKYDQVLDGAELEEAKSQAQAIEDLSFEVITSSDWIGTWNTDHQLDYIKHMAADIKQFSFRLSNLNISQIENEDLKHMMYRVRDYVDSIQQQFLDAGLEPGQKITIMQISGMGTFSIQHVVFKEYEFGQYAQYDKAVKMVFRPENKRNDYYNWYYRDMLIFDGYVDVPESVHYSIEKGANYITKKSKFLSCDNAWYDSSLEYLTSKGVSPIINTYNGCRKK